MAAESARRVSTRELARTWSRMETPLDIVANVSGTTFFYHFAPVTQPTWRRSSSRAYFHWCIPQVPYIWLPKVLDGLNTRVSKNRIKNGGTPHYASYPRSVEPPFSSLCSRSLTYTASKQFAGLLSLMHLSGPLYLAAKSATRAQHES